MTFEEWAIERLPALLATARGICGQSALGEDVLQEVLIKVHSKWAMIGALDARDAYVRRMLVNESISWHRKWAKFIPHADPHQSTARVWALPDESDGVVDRDALLGQISRLPPRQRAVLALRYFADLSDQQIAHDLGCSQVTVRAHAARAIAALRRHADYQVPPTRREPQIP